MKNEDTGYGFECDKFSYFKVKKNNLVKKHLKMATEVPIHFLQSVKPPPTTTIPVEDIPDEDKGTTKN